MELQKGDHQPNQESKQKQAKVKVYHWTYGDGSSIAILSEAGKQTIREFQDYARFKAFLKTQKRRRKNSNVKFRDKELQLHTGLLYYRPNPQSSATYGDGFKAFQKLISSCGIDTTSMATVLELASSILASYYAHFVSVNENLTDHEKLIGPNIRRPPTLIISDKEPVFGSLRQIFNSLAVDTAKYGNKQRWEYNAPSVLPYGGHMNRLIDYAYVYYKDLGKAAEENPFPMEYRETAVLINCKFFTSTDTKSFQRRNPWATIALYGASPRDALDDFIKIDGSVFARCDVTSWDAENLYEVISGYLYWLVAMIYPQERGKKKRAASSYFPSTAMSDYDVESFNLWLFDEWKTADELIFAYNKVRGSTKIQGTYWRWKRLQMVSLSSLLYFFVMAGALNQEQYRAVRNGWWNLLLPGCYPEADVEQDLPITERSVIDVKQNSKEIFEKTLDEIVKAAFPLHVAFYQANSPEPEGKPWGCVRKYYDKTNNKYFKALIFPTRKLRTLGQKFCPVKCDWTRVIPEVRKKPPAYLYPAKACRIWGKSDPQDSIVINLRKATFLSSEVRISINRLFQEGSKSNSV